MRPKQKTIGFIICLLTAFIFFITVDPAHAADEAPMPPAQATLPSLPESDATSAVADTPQTNGQRALVNIPKDNVAPPTASDGVHTPSRKGMVFLGIPFRSGFIIQPQKEQYILEGTEANVDVKSTGINWNPLTTVKVYVTKWTLQSDGTWEKYEDPDPYTAKANGLNKHEAKIRFGPNGRENLPVGTYYFQMRTKYGLFTYYSQLAKVGVVSDETAATAIKITPESNVIFPDMDCDVIADLTPNESTSVVTWSDPNDQVTYEPTFGRNVVFNVSSDILKNYVNTDTENAGMPVTLIGTANGLSDDALIHVGGLKAQKIPIDYAQKDGLSWPVAGLETIYDNFYDEDSSEAAEIKKSAFKWTYYKKNSKGVYTETNFGKEVVNSSGTFTTPDELNTTKALHIPGTSSWLTDAKNATDAGDQYRVKLTITITIKTGLLTSQDIVIHSNQAQLDVTPAVGELNLVRVPNFTFLNVKPEMLYYGNHNIADIYKPSSTETSSDNLLEITDTRPVQSPWTLQARLTGLMSDDADILTGMNLKILGLAQDVLVPATDQWVTVADSATTTAGTFPMSALLYIDADPTNTADLTRNFYGTMVWSLTPTTPEAKALT